MKDMKKEEHVKHNVKEVLKAVGDKCYWFMPSANGFGRAGIPDFIGWVNGHAFAIETKFGRGECTPHQLMEINKAKYAGANVWIVRESNIEEWVAEFRGWVALCS